MLSILDDNSQDQDILNSEEVKFTNGGELLKRKE
jgi:hypothetical protein